MHTKDESACLATPCYIKTLYSCADELVGPLDRVVSRSLCHRVALSRRQRPRPDGTRRPRNFGIPLRSTYAAALGGGSLYFVRAHIEHGLPHRHFGPDRRPRRLVAREVGTHEVCRRRRPHAVRRPDRCAVLKRAVDELRVEEEYLAGLEHQRLHRAGGGCLCGCAKLQHPQIADIVLETGGVAVGAQATAVAARNGDQAAVLDCRPVDRGVRADDSVGGRIALAVAVLRLGQRAVGFALAAWYVQQILMEWVLRAVFGKGWRRGREGERERGREGERERGREGERERGREGERERGREGERERGREGERERENKREQEAVMTSARERCGRKQDASRPRA
eukprot:SAG22_NODE_261_length_13373_cov_17.745472_18_plen_340_part_00